MLQTKFAIVIVSLATLAAISATQAAETSLATRSVEHASRDAVPTSKAGKASAAEGTSLSSSQYSDFSEGESVDCFFASNAYRRECMKDKAK